MDYYNDDRFIEKIMLDYDSEKIEDPPHKEYLRRMEMRIMRLVWANQESGIHHLNLARKVGINRKNLTPYMKRLMRKGLVIRGNGKQGKYYLATEVNRETSVTADIFGEVAASTLLEFYKIFPIDSPYFKNKIINDISPLDHALLMFSNGIGAIITYLLIQSMRPSFDILGKDAKNKQEKDINVKGWFRDAMSSLTDILLPLFTQYMSAPLLISNNYYAKENGMPDLNRAGMDFLRHIFRSPSFMYNEKEAASLIRSFSQTYPSIYSYLDWMKSRLPWSILGNQSSRI